MKKALYTMEKLTPWHKPSAPESFVPLKLYNSLTRTKEEFIPLRPDRVSWYSCGPTVYDSAHMGHARNYVAIDMSRRLLQDYFGYNVEFVQNVTDIDDKIILRARQNHLFAEFSKTSSSAVSVETKEYVRGALAEYVAKHLPDASSTSGDASGEDFAAWLAGVNAEQRKAEDPKFSVYVKAVQSAFATLNVTDPAVFLKGVEPVVVNRLDRERGASVTDHSIFSKLSSAMEQEFNRDMAALNVLPPTVTTRVTEYVPQIIEFIEQILTKGYGYATNDGSVYFDTAAFEAAPNHVYAKLQPWNKGSQGLIDDGEGALSLGTSNKNSNADFVLWKASKHGEPEWDSPWGRGRPGWHIECSVMASHVLGKQIDIHTGGIDNAFPHHDNELAQSEACFDNHQWINYFLHTGHLHIEGQKMSKSLKNFITIGEALKMFSARQLRLAFAFQLWNTPLDFKMSLPHVKTFETALTNYFRTVRALYREQVAEYASKYLDTEHDLPLLATLTSTKTKVHAAFSDSLNIPVALQLLQLLVQAANEYISARRSDVKSELLYDIAKYITHILRVLGFEMDSTFGWPTTEGVAASSSATSTSTNDAEPYVQVVTRFRDDVRRVATSNDADASKQLLALCDRVRDLDLFDLGVALDDRADGRGSLVKFLTPAERYEILEQREAASQQAKDKAARKQQILEEQKKAEADKLERAKVPPTEMFRSSPEYSQFDEHGLPSHDASGQPLTKSTMKKLKKLWDLQNKLHEQYALK